MGAKTYSPKMVVATVGPVILRGFVDGTMIKVSRDVDAFSKHVGADGEVTRVESANKSGSLVASLALSSLANDELSVLALSGACVPVTVKDLSGTTLAFAPNGWVKKPADIQYGKELDGREWTIDLDEVTMFVGGTVRGSLLDPTS
jgi:hypothetical protein